MDDDLLKWAVDTGAGLRALRVARRIRSEDLITRLAPKGITRRVLYKIESGERSATSEERELIIEAIGDLASEAATPA